MPGCVNHYSRQPDKKKGHIEKEGMRKMYERFFLSPPFPFFFLSTNIVLFVVSLGIMCGFCGNVNLLCCFESVRTVCDVQHQCHLLCEEFGSMLKL